LVACDVFNEKNGNHETLVTDLDGNEIFPVCATFIYVSDILCRDSYFIKQDGTKYDVKKFQIVFYIILFLNLKIKQSMNEI